jgi:natural product precursor
MKNLGKLKLNQLSKAELENREMNVLRGGACDGCTCVCMGDDFPTDDYPADTSSNTDIGPSEY